MLGKHGVNRSRCQLHHLLRTGSVSGLDPNVFENPAAKAYKTDVNGVDLGVHGDGDGAMVEVHYGAGSAGLRPLLWHPLADQLQLGKVSNHRADRRTVESGHARQFRTRAGSTVVKEAEDVREIVAPQLLGRGDGGDALLRGLGDDRHVRTPNGCGERQNRALAGSGPSSLDKFCSTTNS